jgi:COP9 signalosome complex subunit 4
VLVFFLHPNALQFKSCYAQLLDQKRKFAEAALRYSELLALVSPPPPASSSSSAVRGAGAAASAATSGAAGGQATVPESEQLAILEKAAVCAVLSPAGPSRQRIMGVLMRDARLLRIKVGVER